MDVLGYDVVDCDGRPPEELINAVISAGKAIYDLAPSDQVFSISIGGNIECDKFLSHGVNMVDIVQKGTRVAYKYKVQQGPRIVRLVRSQLGRVHPKSDRAVSVFKVLKRTPGQGKVKFKIYPYGLSKSEIQPNTRPAATVDLEEHQLLCVLGGVCVEIVSSGDETLVWDGFSALPMGEDVLLDDTLDFTTPDRWNRV
ncbi:hypothetical protein VTN96DRAFT_7023 [Rasamsonia emersonii]